MKLLPVSFLVNCVLSVPQIMLTSAMVDQNASPMLSLSTGHILEGYQALTPSGHSANVFLGVPFAEPPIGQLRFQKTQPLRPLSASNPRSTERVSCRAYKPSCLQNHSTVGDEGIVAMSEDCLYLNVFSGLDCSNENGTLCPVLYYIHGGAFEFDSPTMFSVDVLVDNFASTGIVLVTVPYRLGALGFWSTGSPEAAGNYGVYDVLEGLNWVQREIKTFGGDPRRVTIMGQSSGAAAVSLLTLTPNSRGLFQRAILMSRAPLMSDSLDPYRDLAIDVGCATDDEWSAVGVKGQEITDCMRNIDDKVLVDSYWNLETAYGRHLSGPRIDGPGGLFPDSLPSLIKNRRPIDAIVGTTAEEGGSYKLVYSNATAESIFSLCQSEISGLNLNHQKLLTTECERRYVTSPLRDLEGPASETNFSLWAEQAAKLKGDVVFFSPAFEEGTTLVNAGGKVFLYSFDYVKRGLEGLTPWHSFDLTYILGIHPFEFDERDHQIRATYASLFVNFAKHGHPTPTPNSTFEWKPLQEPPFDMSYLSVDLPTPSMRLAYHYDAVIFWNYIVPTVGERGAEKERGHGVIRSFRQPQPRPSNKMQNLGDAVIENVESGERLESNQVKHTAPIALLMTAVVTATAAFIIAVAVWPRYRKPISLCRRRSKEEDPLLKRKENRYQTF